MISKRDTGISEAGLELYPHHSQDAANVVDWDGNNDPTNPYNWRKGKKWLISVFVCILSLTCTSGSSIYTPAVLSLANHFNVSDVVATLPLSLYVLGWAFGPLFFAPMSEVYGRNFVYRISWTIFTIVQIPCALSTNIGMLLVFRFIAGLSSSPTITICAGTLTDMWTREEIGPPVALISMSAFLGPVFGPIIGGFLAQSYGWRWTFWFMLIAGGVLGIGFALLPETYSATLLERKAKEIRSTTGKEVRAKNAMTMTKAQKMRLSIFRPIQLLVLEPVVFFMCLYLSFVIGVLNLYFAAYVIVFQGTYGLRPGDASLAFLGIGVGVFIATGMAKLHNNLYLKLSAKHGGLYPEARLPYAIIAAMILPGALFWFAWTARESVNKMVPIVSGVFFGWALLMIALPIMGYLTDAYREFSASVMASLTLFRSLLAMSFPLFATKMYSNLSHEWAGSVLGFLAIGLMPIPFLFFKYGAYLRSKSKYTFKG